MLPLSSAETAEREEMFSVFLTSTSNDALIDPTLSSVTITVQQNGSPLGVVSFLGEALSPQRVEERTMLSLPLERTGDNSAAVSVSFVVSQIAGDGQPVAVDVSPASGTVAFPVLQGRANIVLTIVGDEEPESDETFQVALSAVTNGATLNPQADTAVFIIKLVSRSPVYVLRDLRHDLFAYLQCQWESVWRVWHSECHLFSSHTDHSLPHLHNRSSWRGGNSFHRHHRAHLHSGTYADSYNPTAPYVSSPFQDLSMEVIPAVMRSFEASSMQLQVSLPIPQGTYLPPGSVVTVSITNATVTSPADAAGAPVVISPVDGSVRVSLPDQLANIAVGFAAQSLVATANEG